MLIKQKYHKFIMKYLKFLKPLRVHDDSIDFTWGYYAPRPACAFYICQGTYFKQNYAIYLGTIFGIFHITLPFKTKLKAACDMPKYGLDIHHNTIWFHYGSKLDHKYNSHQPKYIAWDIPFISTNFYSHEMKNQNNEWEIVQLKRKSIQDSYNFKKTKALTITKPFTYEMGDDKQECTASCTFDRYTHTRKWLPFIKHQYTHININFSQELGREAGSWKGGVTGLSKHFTDTDTVDSILNSIKNQKL